MKRSIFSKIFIGYFFIIIILSFFIVIFSFRTIKNYYIETLSTDLKNLGIILSIEVKPFIENEKLQELDTFVKKLGKTVDTRITIIAPSGKVFADSEKDPITMENHKIRPEVKKALNGSVGKSLRFSTTVKGEMLYVALPIKNGSELVGLMRTSLFLKDINHLLANLKARMLQIVLLVVFVSMLIAFIFSRSLSRPIGQLALAAREVASENFNVRVSLKNNDELKQLADSFNLMTEKIQTLFTDLSLKTDELNNIITSLREGFLVLNEAGKVIICNDSFKNIIENDSPEGKFWWEVIRVARLGELIKGVLEEKKNLIEEIEFGEKVFLCSITFIPSMNEISLLLHNITEIKRLEKIKKDFVVNVSHELRTPLTAIKGFVETLDEEIDKKHSRYLNIIKRHTERLISIVQDLVLLSELEEVNTKIKFDRVNMKNLTMDVLKLFENKIKQKGLFIKLCIQDTSTIQGDAFKLEQVLINLIDNAVKYTEKGYITLSLKEENKHIKIEIQDTGIGIPEKHIGRIFERFYVVNKSHSRKLGGTGLGLSIVKHIVLSHNGKIDVESAPGKGTRFTITLPSS